jgi:hypothetical protein
MKRFNGKDGKRSGFENIVEDKLKLSRKVSLVEYEVEKFTYTLPASYLPDWRIKTKKGETIYIEAKGRFTGKDRKKLLKVKENYPTIDLRLVFQQDNWISSLKKQRYSDWARKNGFEYSIWPELPL